MIDNSECDYTQRRLHETLNSLKKNPSYTYLFRSVDVELFEDARNGGAVDAGVVHCTTI